MFPPEAVAENADPDKLGDPGSELRRPGQAVEERVFEVAMAVDKTGKNYTAGKVMPLLRGKSPEELMGGADFVDQSP